MRIATQVSGLYTIPPPNGVIFAPMDIASSILTNLMKRGHEVTLYAPKGSGIPGVKTVSFDLQPLKQDRRSIYYDQSLAEVSKGIIETIWDQYLIAKMFLAVNSGDYDLLHLHACHQALPIAMSHHNVPILYTIHDYITLWRRDLFVRFSSPNQWFISVSNAQRKAAPHLHYAATIYNGVRLDEFPFSDRSQSFLLNAGRMIPRKGVEESIDISRKTNQKLVLIGPPEEGGYWTQQIKPRIDNKKVSHYDYKSREKLYYYYQRAKALIFPIQWEEPFGLVMIEAMACGTPVVAFRRGSVPEVVKDGETGFICPPGDMKCMVQAVKRIFDMPAEKYRSMRRACRDHVGKNFTVEKMVDGYEKVYQRVIDEWKRRKRK